MAATKVRTSINSATVMTAGAGDVTGTAVDLSTGYGAQLDIKLTNGATGPTVPAQVQIEVANDTGGTLWVKYGGPVAGVTTASAVSSWSVDLPASVARVRLVSGSNTVQNVTLDADISQVTAI